MVCPESHEPAEYIRTLSTLNFPKPCTLQLIPLNPKPYLTPEQATLFLFLITVSFYTILKKVLPFA